MGGDIRLFNPLQGSGLTVCVPGSDSDSPTLVLASTDLKCCRAPLGEHGADAVRISLFSLANGQSGITCRGKGINPHSTIARSQVQI